MLKSIRMITIVSSLMFPLTSFGAFFRKKDAVSDPEMAARIQQAIAKDDSLTADAASVTVIVENGVVTLKGTVRSDERRAAVQGKAESFAIQAAPLDRIHSVIVHNELTVSPN
jgi:osmotically-inducible protein OsmY